MRTLLAMAATSLLVLSGCSSADEPEPEPTPTPTSTAPVDPTETAIALDEPFTIAGPNYTANVTIERVHIPDMCDGTPNQHPAIEVDIEVTEGDGTSEVLNTGTIRERTPDGYIEKERTVSRNCDGIEELDAMNAQTGDKFRGVRWLKEDVDPKSEILINTPTGGGPITEVFVLDLADLDLDSEPAPAAQAPAAASVETVPETVSEPYVVECLDGTPGPSLMSDGSVRSTDYCGNRPGAAETRFLEGNCSDMAWRNQMGLEGDQLCGSSMFADGLTGGN